MLCMEQNGNKILESFKKMTLGLDLIVCWIISEYLRYFKNIVSIHDFRVIVWKTYFFQNSSIKLFKNYRNLYQCRVWEKLVTVLQCVKYCIIILYVGYPRYVRNYQNWLQPIFRMTTSDYSKLVTWPYQQ